MNPLINRWVYKTSVDLERVILKSRHVGFSITPIVSHWPCMVNLLIPSEGGMWESKCLDLLDVGWIEPCRGGTQNDEDAEGERH